MNELQAYMVHEYVADFKAGHLARRDLVRRVLNITGGVGSTATLLLSLGCQSSAGGGGSAPAATAAKPAAAAAASPAPSAAASPAPSAAASPSASTVPSPSPGLAASPSPSPSPLPHSPLAGPPNDPTIDGQDITYAGADGATIMAYQARLKSTTGALPLVLVCHQNRGLNEHIRDVVRRFAKEGYIACGVDLLSRQGGTAKITNPNQFSALLTGPNVNPDQFVSDFKSAVAYYQTKPDLVQFDKLAMNGFCFGGGVVWRSTQQIPQLKAASPWYGAPPPLDQVGNIKAAVLGIYSSDPNDFANNGRDQLEQALTAAKVAHKFNVYPGTMHAFNDDTGPAFNQDQALAAWRDMINWFKQYLA
jgi:carboxymethylenebutenolidase